MISSAISGVLMRLDATTGTDTSGRSLPVTHEKAPRGTDVTIVGMRASCQPIPVLRIETPAASSFFARFTVSSQLCASSTRSSSEIRYITMKSLPTASRTCSTISTGNRMRFSADPPQRSERSLVRAVSIWLIR